MKNFFYILCSAFLILTGLILIEKQTVNGRVKLCSFMRSKDYRIGFEDGRRGRTDRKNYSVSYRNGWLEGYRYGYPDN